MGRCKQTLFGIGLELDCDEKMRFVWITICCISAALAALNVDEGQGGMVQQVEQGISDSFNNRYRRDIGTQDQIGNKSKNKNGERNKETKGRNKTKKPKKNKKNIRRNRKESKSAHKKAKKKINKKNKVKGRNKKGKKGKK